MDGLSWSKKPVLKVQGCNGWNMKWPHVRNQAFWCQWFQLLYSDPLLKLRISSLQVVVHNMQLQLFHPWTTSMWVQHTINHVHVIPISRVLFDFSEIMMWLERREVKARGVGVKVSPKEWRLILTLGRFLLWISASSHFLFLLSLIFLIPTPIRSRAGYIHIRRNKWKYLFIPWMKLSGVWQCKLVWIYNWGFVAPLKT